MLALFAAGSGAADAAGVPPGSAVIARTNPSNGVVSAVRRAAAEVGLGAVTATGFRADCSPVPSRAVVCRDSSLHQGHTGTAVVLGANSCVVHADPRLGGSNPGVQAMTNALRQCVAPAQPTTTTSETTTTTAASTTSTTG
jgi:hypothetical protein